MYLVVPHIESLPSISPYLISSSSLALIGTTQFIEASRSNYAGFGVFDKHYAARNILKRQLYIMYQLSLIRYSMLNPFRKRFIRSKYFSLTPDNFEPEEKDINLYLAEPKFLWRFSFANYNNLVTIFQNDLLNSKKSKCSVPANIDLYPVQGDSSTMVDYLESTFETYRRSFLGKTNNFVPLDYKKVLNFINTNFTNFNLNDYESCEYLYSDDYHLHRMDPKTTYKEFIQVVLTGRCERFSTSLFKDFTEKKNQLRLSLEFIKHKSKTIKDPKQLSDACLKIIEDKEFNNRNNSFDVAYNDSPKVYYDTELDKNNKSKIFNSSLPSLSRTLKFGSKRLAVKEAIKKFNNEIKDSTGEKSRDQSYCYMDYLDPNNLKRTSDYFNYITFNDNFIKDNFGDYEKLSELPGFTESQPNSALVFFGENTSSHPNFIIGHLKTLVDRRKKEIKPRSDYFNYSNWNEEYLNSALITPANLFYRALTSVFGYYININNHIYKNSNGEIIRKGWGLPFKEKTNNEIIDDFISIIEDETWLSLYSSRSKINSKDHLTIKKKIDLFIENYKTRFQLNAHNEFDILNVDLLIKKLRVNNDLIDETFDNSAHISISSCGSEIYMNIGKKGGVSSFDSLRKKIKQIERTTSIIPRSPSLSSSDCTIQETSNLPPIIQETSIAKKVSTNKDSISGNVSALVGCSPPISATLGFKVSVPKNSYNSNAVLRPVLSITSGGCLASKKDLKTDSLNETFDIISTFKLKDNTVTFFDCGGENKIKSELKLPTVSTKTVAFSLRKGNKKAIIEEIKNISTGSKAVSRNIFIDSNALQSEIIADSCKDISSNKILAGSTKNFSNVSNFTNNSYNSIKRNANIETSFNSFPTSRNLSIDSNISYDFAGRSTNNYSIEMKSASFISHIDNMKNSSIRNVKTNPDNSILRNGGKSIFGNANNSVSTEILSDSSSISCSSLDNSPTVNTSIDSMEVNASEIDQLSLIKKINPLSKIVSSILHHFIPNPDQDKPLSGVFISTNGTEVQKGIKLNDSLLDIKRKITTRIPLKRLKRVSNVFFNARYTHTRPSSVCSTSSVIFENSNYAPNLNFMYMFIKANLNELKLIRKYEECYNLIINELTKRFNNDYAKYVNYLKENTTTEELKLFEYPTNCNKTIIDDYNLHPTELSPRIIPFGIGEEYTNENKMKLARYLTVYFIKHTPAANFSTEAFGQCILDFIDDEDNGEKYYKLFHVIGKDRHFQEVYFACQYLTRFSSSDKYKINQFEFDLFYKELVDKLELNHGLAFPFDYANWDKKINVCSFITTEADC